MHKKIIRLVGPLDKNGDSFVLKALVRWNNGANAIEQDMTLEDVFEYLFDIIEEQKEEIQSLKNKHLKYGGN